MREYGVDGLRNAFHLICKCATPSMVSFLQKLKINPDQPDYDEVTPFNLLSNSIDSYQTTTFREYFNEFFDKLLDLNIRVDYPDKKGRTPFLNYYDRQRFELAYRMLDMGANINQMDISGLFALKYALIRR